MIITRTQASKLLQGHVDRDTGSRISDLSVTGTVTHDDTVYVVADDLLNQRTVHFVPATDRFTAPFDSVWIELPLGLF